MKFRKTLIATLVSLSCAASFSAINTGINVTGPSSALTLNATVTPTSEFINNNSKLYFLLVKGNDVYSYTDTAGFVPYPGGANALLASNAMEPPPLRSITRTTETIALAGDARVAAGADVYVGYGTSFTELLTSARFAKLYTFQTRPEDLALICEDSLFYRPIPNTINPDFQFGTVAWGVRNIIPPSAYSTCAGAAFLNPSTLVSRYTWDFNSIAGGGVKALGASFVKVNPSVSYGWLGFGEDNSPTLPKQVSTVNSLSVGWDVKINHHLSQNWVPPTPQELQQSGPQVGDGGNILLEVWFGHRLSTPADRGDQHSVELGINLVTWGSMDFHNFAEERVTIDGIDYLYHLEPPTASILHSFAVLKAVTPNITAAQINMIKYIEFLKARGLVADTDYLMNITFGSEISEGAGEVLVNKFSVNLN